ncbi:PH domain-containing protein [Stenotrophomonas sp.]|uniref:PH domain-containing protein n=1 Tax=Stenotrophomonas sp. TaxID=69392 RepID=UPI0028A63C6B|nr:PH domain-containing protein [Stenotrophomonas sp.]
MIDAPELPTPRFSDDSQWHPLPPRGAVFAAIGSGLSMALLFGVASVVLMLVTRQTHWLLWPLAAVAVGALLGAWFGWRRHRLTFWRLDAQSLGVRRGHMWQSESHVPVSRVQHLDLRRGPLERIAGLATLIVHTAGTRMNTVAVAGLAHADAERLRDRLARQLDHDDDAL